MSVKKNPFNKSAGESAMTGGPGHNSPMALASIMDQPKDFKSTLKRLLKFFRKYLPTILVVCIFAIISTLLAVLAPKIISHVINSIEKAVTARIAGSFVSINFLLIYQFLAILFGVYVVSTSLIIVEHYLMTNVSQNIVRDMRSEVKTKLTKLPLSFFDRITHGELLSRAVGDVENIAVTLQENVVQLISGIVTLSGVFLMMLFINRILTVVVLVTIPMYFFVGKPMIKRAQKLFKKRQKANGQLNSLIEEMYGGLKTVKAYGKENETKKQFTAINNVYCNSGWKAQFITGTIMPFMSFLTNFAYVLICVSSGLLYTMNIISLGDVTAFLIYVKLFAGPVNQITSITNSIQSSIASAERIFAIFDEQEETNSNKHLAELEDGDVKFKHISFQYNPGTPLIENLSLHVKSGQTVAIVGPTGAGKTTLVNLLMRFYDLDQGNIFVGGVNASVCNRSDIRKQFGMVLQDTWLFHGTIMENIRYGKDGAFDQECIEAAKKAQAHHFICTLPNGYNTILNEEASNISKGEKQLITIARTLLHNPKILILDEATSNVDTLTDQRIQDGLNEIMKNRTCFIIAHRLSTIKNANKILVMQNGTIVETGCHDSLLKQNGVYAELYQAQFSLLC